MDGSHPRPSTNLLGFEAEDTLCTVDGDVTGKSWHPDGPSALVVGGAARHVAAADGPRPSALAGAGADPVHCALVVVIFVDIDGGSRCAGVVDSRCGP